MYIRNRWQSSEKSVWEWHLESEIHDIHEIGSGTKLYYLWVKGYSTWGERETIFLCWLLLHHQLSTQPIRGARNAQIRLALPSSESQLSRSEAGTQLTAFLKSPNAQPTLPGMTSFTSPGLISYLGPLLWHLWMTHPPRARDHLH